MKFIEITGGQLSEIVADDELHIGDLAAAGITETTVLRVNQQGDLEVRRRDRWDVVGGLIGAFEERLKAKTGLEWA